MIVFQIFSEIFLKLRGKFRFLHSSLKNMFENYIFVFLLFLKAFLKNISLRNLTINQLKTVLKKGTLANLIEREMGMGKGIGKNEVR